MRTLIIPKETQRTQRTQRKTFLSTLCPLCFLISKKNYPKFSNSSSGSPCWIQIQYSSLLLSYFLIASQKTNIGFKRTLTTQYICNYENIFAFFFIVFPLGFLRFSFALSFTVCFKITLYPMVQFIFVLLSTSTSLLLAS